MTEINKVYSFNGYDPTNAETVRRKAVITQLYSERTLNTKEFTAKMSELKEQWTSLLEVPPEELNGTTIQGSCFACQEPNTKMFMDGVKDIEFDGCNCDNTILPPGSTLINGSTNRQIKTQNDGEDWVLDKDLKPVEPLHRARFERYGLSCDPKSIPEKKVDVPVTVAAQTLKMQDDRKNQILSLASDPAKMSSFLTSGRTL